MKKFLAFVFVGLIVCSGAWAAQVTINATASQVLSVATANAFDSLCMLKALLNLFDFSIVTLL